MASTAAYSGYNEDGLSDHKHMLLKVMSMADLAKFMSNTSIPIADS